MADEDITALTGAGRYEEAFELLVNRYQKKGLRLAFSIAGDAAEDVAQDAFLRIWRALPAYRGDSSLSTWIYTIIKNTALSARRRKLPQTCELIEPPTPSVAAESATHDLLAKIQQLPDGQRAAVILYYLEDKSYIETAAILNLPMGTVKTYLHRARKELAALLLEKVK